ncbi:MAG: DEAD/DEAH box helicase family protein [Acidobacteriota bacterium]|nr:DEAD/DEAH box helicase family protein [Acidobacteriota bacterium]
MANVIENPILNSPYEAPTRHWKFDDDGITDQVLQGRRPSAYFMPIPAAKRRQAAQAQLEFVEWTKDRIEETRFVNEIRVAVNRWRLEGWPGATATTRILLEHWNAPERERKLFFCQIGAVETAMWLAEIAGKAGVGRYILSELERYNEDANPGLFRVAHKMATGTGKTAVMSMIIAWQTLNKAANPHDGRFSDAFLVVAPGITIRDCLRVLFPSDAENYYRGLDIVPSHLRDQLGQARIVVTNFHGFLHREMSGRVGADPLAVVSFRPLKPMQHDVSGATAQLTPLRAARYLGCEIDRKIASYCCLESLAATSIWPMVLTGTLLR